MINRVFSGFVLVCSVVSLCLYFFPLENYFAPDVSKHLKVAVYKQHFTLLPSHAVDVVDSQILMHTYEGLFRFSSENEVTPGLVDTYNVSEDGLEYRFNIKKSFWSDGSRLTAIDFARSFYDACSNVNFAYKISCIRGFEESITSGDGSKLDVNAVNDRLLIVKLKYPVKHFLHLLCSPYLAPVHTSGHDKYVSNGPFVVTYIKDGYRLVLSKNKYFWDAKSVGISGIDIHVVHGDVEALDLFKKNKVDLIGAGFSFIGAKSREELRRGAFNYVERTPMSVDSIFINMKDEVLKCPEVRRALSMSINRSSLCNDACMPAFSFVPYEGSSKYSYPISEDAEQAVKVFNSSVESYGFKPSKLKWTMLCSRGSNEMACLVRDMWNRGLGLYVDVDVVDFDTLISRVKSSKFDFAVVGIRGDLQDDSAFYDVFMKGSPYCQLISSQLSNSLDNALKSDACDRHLALKKVEESFLSDLPCIPLVFNVDCLARSDRLKNFSYCGNGLVDLSRAHLSRD